MSFSQVSGYNWLYCFLFYHVLFYWNCFKYSCASGTGILNGKFYTNPMIFEYYGIFYYICICFHVYLMSCLLDYKYKFLENLLKAYEFECMDFLRIWLFGLSLWKKDVSFWWVIVWIIVLAFWIWKFPFGSDCFEKLIILVFRI